MAPPGCIELYKIQKRNLKETNLSSQILLFRSSRKLHNTALGANFHKILALLFNLWPLKKSYNWPSTLLGRQIHNSKIHTSSQQQLAKGPCRKMWSINSSLLKHCGQIKGQKERFRLFWSLSWVFKLLWANELCHRAFNIGLEADKWKKKPEGTNNHLTLSATLPKWNSNFFTNQTYCWNALSK